jgi:hypothetical protein
MGIRRTAFFKKLADVLLLFALISIARVATETDIFPAFE